MFERLIIKSLAFAGLLLCVLFACSLERLAALVLLAGAMVIAHHFRDRLSGVHWGVLGRHPMVVLALLGLLARTLIACAALSPKCAMIFSTQEIHLGADYVVLWQCIKEVCRGVWPTSKSWTTVVAYALGCKVVGVSVLGAYVISSVLQFASALCCYSIARDVRGRLAGILAFALFWLNPIIVFHCRNIATEHTFTFCLLLALLCFLRAVTSVSCGRAFLYFTASCVATWLCVWSRGEGILLWPTMLAVFVFLFASSRISFGRLCVCLGIGVVVFFCGACFAIRVNGATSGARTVFCSDDNYWPRLFGANLATGGMVNSDDMWLIYRQYAADTGDPHGYGASVVQHNTPVGFLAKCPPDVVPYIKREIRRRWSSMSPVRMLSFVLEKEARVWAKEDVIVSMPNHRMVMFAQSVSLSVVPIVIVVSSLLVFWGLAKKTCGRIHMQESCLVFVVVFTVGLVMVYAIAESAPRYGWTLSAIWCIIAAIGASKCSEI